MAACATPIPESTLIDYWSGDLASDDDGNRVETHLFACGECSDRLAALAALGASVSRLAREGRFDGIVTRALVNRLQRDGVRVRMFSLAPGETVPCAVFPGDELVVSTLKADLSGVGTVTLSVTSPDQAAFGRYEDVPVSETSGEVLWLTPAPPLHRLPSMRLELTLSSTGDAPTELGRYVLEHTASPPTSGLE